MSKKYQAFISYRHADNKVEGRQWATWLHQAIETYDVPDDLVGKVNDRGDEIPARIFPIFRDEEELPADADLGGAITRALDETNLLVVLCSPRAVESTYVAQEIDYFKSQGGSNRVIAAMIDGEPNTSLDDSKQALGFKKDDECFPVPLQYEYDLNGKPTTKIAEPIAADFRINEGGKPTEGWTSPEAYRRALKESGVNAKETAERVAVYQKQSHLMLLKIIAGIIGVPLGDLTKRDKEYQLELERAKAKKLRQWLSAVAMLAIIAIGAGTFAYFKQQQAETLLGEVRKNRNFMIFDLRQTLKKYVPTKERVDLIKRIDALVELLKSNGNNSLKDQREGAMALWQKVDTMLLSSDLKPLEALELLLQAHNFFLEQVSADFGNTEYLTDLGASYNKLGNIYLRLGDTEKGLIAYKDGLEISEILTGVDPRNIQFQQGLSVSYSKLGNIYLRLDDTDQALTAINTGLVTQKKLTTLDPSNTEFQRGLSVTHSQLGNIYLRLGDMKKALTSFNASLVIHQKLTTLDPHNIQLQKDLVHLYNKSGDIYLRLGDMAMALKIFEASLAINEKLTTLDPINTKLKLDLGFSHNKIGAVYLRLGDNDKALKSYEASLIVNEKITALEPRNSNFQRSLMVSYYGIYNVYNKLGEVKQALSYIQMTHKKLLWMQEQGLLVKNDLRFIKQFEVIISELKVKLNQP